MTMMMLLLLHHHHHQVFYHLEAGEEALKYALGAGNMFDVNEGSEYADTLVGE